MSTVLSLPTELLCQIADFVDSTDLSNMRLVCKPLRDAANMPFGIAYIKNRRHVLTQKSIEVLLEIVAHPAFGAYVDSISVVPLFPTAWTVPSLNQSGLVAYVKSRSHMQLMKQVFIKIRENQNSVHINICDAASNMSGYGCAEMLDSGSVLHPCPTETLENTLLAAIRANCHVRSLELSMHQHKFIDLQEALEDLLSPTRPPLRLIIHCPRKRTRVLHCPYTITYNQADHSLKLDGCDVYELAAAKEGSSIKRLLGFLLAQTTQLILERCHLCSAFASFLALDKTGTLAQNLTSVHMPNFRPCRSASAVPRHHWSGIFRVLSKLVGLKYFNMEGLRACAYWDLFHLPRTTEKHEISGEDVAEQLEALAVLVATEPVKEEISPLGGSSSPESPESNQ